MGGVRMFNPVIGAGNPVAPPMRVEIGAGGAEGWCTLGHAYEGPPMYGHGGVSAMLIDQLLGHAAAASGHPGVTTDLSVRYRRPVPLDVPLRISACVTGTEGRRLSAMGGVTTAAEPGVPLVEAEARFARLRPIRPAACSAVWPAPTPPIPTWRTTDQAASALLPAPVRGGARRGRPRRRKRSWQDPGRLQ